MDKTKLDLIDALKAFKHASVVLSEKWERHQAETDVQLGCGVYPFESSFDGVADDVIEWVDSFINELTPPQRFWIDLRNNHESHWIYKQEGDKVHNELNGDVLDSADGLTEISEAKYNEIFDIWNEPRYLTDYRWNDRDICQDIQDVVDRPESQEEQDEIDLGNAGDHNYQY